jgi:hypothetical protein
MNISSYLFLYIKSFGARIYMNSNENKITASKASHLHMMVLFLNLCWLPKFYKNVPVRLH